MEARLYNPDGLPVVDAIEQDARLLLVDARIAPHTLAGRLFVYLWRACQGRPGDVTTSQRALGREFPEDSPSNLRKALRQLERAALLALPDGRHAGDFAVGVRRAAPKSDAQAALFDKRLHRQKASLAVVGAPEPGRAPEVRTSGAHSECAPTVRTASARPMPPPEEKNTATDAKFVQRLNAALERKRAAAPAPTARRLLECSYIPDIPLSQISSDIPNIPECSRNVEANEQTTGNIQSPSSRGEALLHLIDRIERKIGTNDTHGWMAYSVALCVVVGPLSEAQIESAIESTANWKLFTGAVKRQLGTCSEADLRQHGLWSESAQAMQFHRWPDIKKRLRALGVEVDETRFPPRAKGKR